MSDLIYFCVQDGNDCSKKEDCKRYVKSFDDKNKATLFKAACTKENDYQLFIKNAKEESEC